MHNLSMEKNNKYFNPGRVTFSIMVLFCSVLIGAVLKIASSVFLPFTIAVLLVFVMYPLIRCLDKCRIPRILSIVLVIMILIAGLFAFGMVFVTTGSNIIDAYYRYEDRVTDIYIWIAQFFELDYDEYLSVWENIWGQLGVRTWVRDFALSFTNIFLNFIGSAVVVLLFVLFLLLEASFLKEKLETAFDNRSDRIKGIGQYVMIQVSRYLTAKFFISLANGIIFAVAFHFIGLEFAVLWGVIAFVLNFIPNLGSIVASVAISLFALIQFWPEPGPVIMVVAVILVVNLFLCNIFDPKIVGEHVGLSPLVILVSLALWGWIWGFAGMILAVPMTVIIKIVCENIPFLEPVSVLLGTRKSVRARKAEQSARQEQEQVKENHETDPS